MIETQGAFCAVIVLDNGERKILLGERADGKGFDLPGGGVEEGETPQEAAARECFEEASIRVEIGDQVGDDQVFEKDGKRDIARVYSCRFLEGVLYVGPEVKSLRFFSLRELTSPGAPPIVGKPTYQDPPKRMFRMIEAGLKLAPVSVDSPDHLQGDFIADMMADKFERRAPPT